MKFSTCIALLVAASAQIVSANTGTGEVITGLLVPAGTTPSAQDESDLKEVITEVQAELTGGSHGSRRLQTDVSAFIDSVTFVPYFDGVKTPENCPQRVLDANFMTVQDLIDKNLDCYVLEWNVEYALSDARTCEEWKTLVETAYPTQTVVITTNSDGDKQCQNIALHAIVQEILDEYIAEYRAGSVAGTTRGTAVGDTSEFYSEFRVPMFNGDPHVKTLGGNWFEYHGECDLVFIHAPSFYEGKDLFIHARTTIRQSYSFISSAAVRLGESTLEVASFGEYALNGVDAADLNKETFEGYKVNYNKPNKKNTKFEILLGGEQKIVLSAFKDLVAIKMEGFGKEFANSSGLLGTLEGKLLGRDGVTEFTDMNEFGQEWQVRDTEPMLFRSARAPQFPTETCRLPKVSTADTRRRLGEGMAREKAERACAHFSGAQFENCVFDVMAIGDIDLAQAGAY